MALATQLGSVGRIGTRDARTKEAEAFLLLQGDQLTAGLNNYVREFVKGKLA
jgi:hypothetical protein